MSINRRDFIKGSIQATAAASVLHASGVEAFGIQEPFKFLQVALPYAYNALEPHIDAMTMDIHYNKHHGAYLKNVTDAFAAEKIVVKDAADFFSRVGSFSSKARNNGGGVWNHNFFWQVMKPGAAAPAGKVAEALTGAFGSVDQFKEQFSKAAMGRFGSGWAWLVKSGGKLAIGSTPNQDNPLMPGGDINGTPLLALDVWEHAYYLKYQNKRVDYVNTWWNLVNWDEVARNL
ncbi:MAG: superoxide dismutase [Bacteroidota bacterium]